MCATEPISFAQQLRDQRGRPMPEGCPWCSYKIDVYETPQGLIDCPRCPPRAAPKEVTRVNLQTLEVERVELTAEQKQRREIADCMREDQQRGEKGGGSSGPSRKKPVKRERGFSRVEQDEPSFLGRRGDSKKTVRLCKMTRVELIVSEDCRNFLRKLAYENRRNDGTLEPTITTLRRFLVASKLTTLRAIPRLEYGGEKKSIWARLTAEELSLLDQVSEEFEVSRGEVVEAGVWAFLKGEK